MNTAPHTPSRLTHAFFIVVTLVVVFGLTLMMAAQSGALALYRVGSNLFAGKPEKPSTAASLHERIEPRAD